MTGSAIQVFHARINGFDIVRHDATLGDQMTGSADTLHQERAGFVVLEIARVGNRQHRDFQRHELFVLIDPRHGYTLRQRKPLVPAKAGTQWAPARMPAYAGISGILYYSASADSVLQAAMLPSRNPAMNQRLRCSEVP